MARSLPRLTWFELQVCPSAFRFAALPGQAILIGFDGPEGTSLVPYAKGARETYLRIMDALNDVVDRHRVLETEMRDPDGAFEDGEAMGGPSLHFRFARGEETAWASVFPLDEMPGNVRALLEECQALAREVLAECPSRVVSGDEAREVMHSGGEPPPPERVVRVTVRRDGRLFVDCQPMGVAELQALLFGMRDGGGGGVMYHRESPEEEGPAIVDAVIDAITAARLPIRLCQREDEAPGDGQWYWPNA